MGGGKDQGFQKVGIKIRVKVKRGRMNKRAKGKKKG